MLEAFIGKGKVEELHSLFNQNIWESFSKQLVFLSKDAFEPFTHGQVSFERLGNSVRNPLF